MMFKMNFSPILGYFKIDELVFFIQSVPVPTEKK